MKRITTYILLLLAAMAVQAQINTDQVMRIGRNSLYFEDYVLSIQYFNQVIKAKPFLAEPYFYRAVAKINLEDYQGAEADASLAIERNPFIVDAYQVRGVARQNLRDFEGAIADYDKGLELMPEENEDDWTKGVTTGMIGATLRMSGAFYDFSSPAARKHALGEEGYGASMLLTSETFLKEHPLLSFEYIGDYDDEGRPTPLPADMVSRLEKKYGQQCKRSEIGFRIQDKYLYGVIQFKPQGTKVLALEVLSDGKDLWTEEHWGDCRDGEEGSVWNVDDGGEYFLSSLVAVVQGDEFPILFFTRSAPESTTPGWMTVMGGKFVRATLEAYYMYYQ